MAVLFQMCKSYKQDLTITNFEIHIDLQIIHSNWRNNNFDRSFIGYNRSALLTPHISKSLDGITFASNTSNIFFAHNRIIDTKNEIRNITSVQLKMEPLSMLPIYEKK